MVRQGSRSRVASPPAAASHSEQHQQQHQTREEQRVQRQQAAPSEQQQLGRRASEHKSLPGAAAGAAISAEAPSATASPATTETKGRKNTFIYSFFL